MLAEIENWVDSGILLERNQILDRGLRYSPKSIKAMAYKVATSAKIGFKEAGFSSPHPDSRVLNDFSIPYKMEISFYLYLTGMLNDEEYKNFIHTTTEGLGGQGIEIPVDISDLFLGKKDRRVRNVIRPNIDVVAKDIEKIRQEKPWVAVVFNHGKWNGFPHCGYMLAYLDVMEAMSDMGYHEADVIYVIANDTNSDIKEAGSQPFLNTSWRMSLNSYLPYDFIYSSGDFGSYNNVNKHWNRHYELLKPDFIVADPDDPVTPFKVARVKELGLDTKFIFRKRFGSLTREPIGETTYDQSVSQTGLKKFDYNILVAMQAKKHIIECYNEGHFERDANWREFLNYHNQL